LWKETGCCAKKREENEQYEKMKSHQKKQHLKSEKSLQKSEWLTGRFLCTTMRIKETYSYKVVQSPNSNLEKHQISKDSVFPRSNKVSPGTRFQSERIQV
jgi:hypothetical protein